MPKGRYMIQGKPEHPVYHYSWIRSFFQCPMKFKLAGIHNLPLESQAVKHGKIFERILLGDFDGELSTLTSGRGKIYETLESCAEYVSHQYFDRHSGDFSEDEAQHKELIDCGEYGYGGAYDYYGPYTTRQQEQNTTFQKAIVDLKYTANYDYSLYGANEDFHKLTTHLQAISYTWMHWRKHKEIIPFVRLVVEGKHAPTPFIKETVYELSAEVYAWFEKKLNLIHQTAVLADGEFLEPTEDIETCFHGKHVCQYLGLCKTGRQRRSNQGGPSRIELKELLK